MNTNSLSPQQSLPAYALIKEPKVDPMWSADEAERRIAIIRRAAEGARKTLRGK